MMGTPPAMRSTDFVLITRLAAGNLNTYLCGVRKLTPTSPLRRPRFAAAQPR